MMCSFRFLEMAQGKGGTKNRLGLEYHRGELRTAGVYMIR